MSKRLKQVLVRLNGISAPDNMGVEIIDRDDERLRQQRAEGQLLPGQKVFQTNLEVDRPWRMGGVFGDIQQVGFFISNVSQEMRGGQKSGKKTPVLTLSFEPGDQHRYAPGFLAWMTQYFQTNSFELAMMHRNPLVGGGQQLVIDVCRVVPVGFGQKFLPLRPQLGIPSPKHASSV